MQASEDTIDNQPENTSEPRIENITAKENPKLIIGLVAIIIVTQIISLFLIIFPKINKLQDQLDLKTEQLKIEGQRRANEINRLIAGQVSIHPVYRLKGNIKDTNGDVINNALLETDGFIFNALSDGTFDLTFTTRESVQQLKLFFTAPGYKTKVIDAEFAEHSVLNYDIALKKIE